MQPSYLYTLCRLIGSRPILLGTVRPAGESRRHPDSVGLWKDQTELVQILTAAGPPEVRLDACRIRTPPGRRGEWALLTIAGRGGSMDAGIRIDPAGQEETDAIHRGFLCAGVSGILV